MLQIAICEDGREDLQLLHNHVQQYLSVRQLDAEINSFPSGEALLEAFLPGRFHIMFLDVYMNGMTGVEAARVVRGADRQCAIVFVTSSKEHAVEGFEVQAAHYLIKPILYPHICDALERCMELVPQSMLSIRIRSGKTDAVVPMHSIQYIEVYDKVSHIHRAVGTLTTYTPLDTLEKQLNCASFLRCHRSYLVNMQHVTRIEEKYILMQNDDKIPYSKNNRRAVREQYMEYIVGLTREKSMQL